MAPQAWILLSCTLLAVFVASRGLVFEMVRSPGNYHCARLGCINDVNTDVSTYSTKELIVYGLNPKGTRTKLAYIDFDKPNLVIDSYWAKVVNGTGHISKNHVDVTLDFSREADCLRGTYICELAYAGVKGTREVISETIVPGEQSGECSCSTITEKFASLTTRANDITSSILAQRQANGDLDNEVGDLRQDLNEKQNALEKLTQAGALMRESINIQIQNNKDNQEEIAAQQRSDELLAGETDSLMTNDAKQEEALAEQRKQDEANAAAIVDLRRVNDAVRDELNARYRFDAVLGDTIKQLKRKDDSLENQADDMSRTHRSLQEQVNTLRESDSNQASQIKVLQSTNDAQAQSVSQLTSSFESQLNQFSQLREADATIKTKLEGISTNNTAFDAAILVLRRSIQENQQDLAALSHKDQVSYNQINLLNANDARFDKDISGLQVTDTLLWKQIGDRTAADNDITGQISGLQSKATAFSVRITVLSKTDADLQVKISNQSAVYQSLREQVQAMSQKNVQLLQKLSELKENILLLQHYINASHVTTVVKTTTKLSTVKCTRGMVHTSPRQTIVVNGVPSQCDTETDGGGYVVIERRVSDDVDFKRTWADYKKGFGSVDSSYFIGLEPLHLLSDLGFNELRIDFKVDDKTYYAHYDVFKVGGEDAYYKLNVKDYSGDAGDSFSYYDGAVFSTSDSDHDADAKNCADISGGGGWWYKDCLAGLNGVYGHVTPDGIYWKTLNLKKPIQYLEMKVRNPNYEQGYN